MWLFYFNFLRLAKKRQIKTKIWRFRTNFVLIWLILDFSTLTLPIFLLHSFSYLKLANLHPASSSSSFSASPTLDPQSSDLLQFLRTKCKSKSFLCSLQVQLLHHHHCIHYSQQTCLLSPLSASLNRRLNCCSSSSSLSSSPPSFSYACIFHIKFLLHLPSTFARPFAP